MADTFAPALFDRTRLARAADALAVAVVVSLPWSTTATIILIVLWLGAVLPTLDMAAVRREVLTPAGGLPVLFWLLAAVGMLWADVSLHERLGGLGSFHRLLLIPLLLAQFRRSENGRWVVTGFVASCTVLLAVSYVHAALWTGIPGLPGRFGGVPFKDYIMQSEEFQLCVFGLAYVAAEAWRERRLGAAMGFGLLAAAFLADIVYLGTGRTALAVMPVLLVLFGWREFGWKGALAAALAGLCLAAVFWLSSHYLRDRITSLGNEIQNYESRNWSTSAGARIEFWKKSLGFVAAAPIIGHGTGSISEQFRVSVSGEGPSAIPSDNPHQQTLTVAIQLGLVGVAVLFALWIAHVLLFTGSGIVAWAGLIVVVQNIVGSLFNSHLFDFTQGWMYVFAVGALGGTVLAKRPAAGSAK